MACGLNVTAESVEICRLAIAELFDEPLANLRRDDLGQSAQAFSGLAHQGRFLDDEIV